MTLERIYQNSETLLELLEACNNLDSQRNHIINRFQTNNLPKNLRKQYKKSFNKLNNQIETYLKNVLSVTKNIEKIAKDEITI